MPVTSKLVERAVMLQMVDYMEKSWQLNPLSNAYRKHHGTMTAMIEIADAIFTVTDINQIATVMTINESNMLLDKLAIYNFGESEIEWFREYLSYWMEYVTVSGKNSRMKPVKKGVPQGSVLGPVLFMIYVNKLPEELMEKETCRDAIHEPSENLFANKSLKYGMTENYADDVTVIMMSNSREENKWKIEENLRKNKVIF